MQGNGRANIDKGTVGHAAETCNTQFCAARAWCEILQKRHKFVGEDLAVGFAVECLLDIRSYCTKYSYRDSHQPP